ncbi:MAG: hypothetical protein H0U63_04310 [Burkholderiales bacterium]|nr:hypothetical protein [Burkholderiales bacterium]
MADDPGLLGKLDALLNKHRKPSGPTDVEIPLLTDRVEPATVGGDGAPLPTAASAPVDSGSPLSDSEAEALAHDIFHRVMDKLGAQLSSDLRDHLTQRLSSIIDSTVATAIADFKQELANTIGDAIAEALLERSLKMASSEKDDPPKKTPDSL